MKEGTGVELQRGEDPQKDYEQMVQSLEEEARNHIRIEQQLKLHIDSLQEKIEEKEKTEEKLKAELHEKSEFASMLKEKLKECVSKYNKLKQALKTPIDNPRSKSNVSTEEMIKKPHITLHQIKNVNDATKKVKFDTILIEQYSRGEENDKTIL
eukprot:TRINITY_DN5986_c0_g1_i22.p2 TRINITY_DN5986_c0_g1~~TRINITY_DN5986_c0_g1_i22.p2  ORF type:complete len:154 (+),score=56.41 TRINITY_DN5986_c0_g1_i22:428-889(+)